MTGLIAIDESGDLGLKGSRYFVVAAIITENSRGLKRAYKAIPKENTQNKEMKFYNVAHKNKVNVLKEIADAKVAIAFIYIDKNEQKDTFGYGNKLYKKALEEVVGMAIQISSCVDVDVFVDTSSFITNDDFKKMVAEASEKSGKNLKKCSKVSNNKCVRVADYAVGAIWTKYEHMDDEFFEIVKEVIRCP